MTTIPAEKRVQGIELRDVETTDTLTMMRGRAVPYGVETDIGWYLEQFARGALAKSIKEAAAALPLLLFHDGRSFPIGSSAKYDEQDDGLYPTWKLDGSDEAQRAAKLAKDGHLNFLSIGFQPIRSTWTYVEDWNPDLGAANKDRVTRDEARLLEVSMVTTPAYKDAAVEWVRTGERPLQRDQPGRELAEWRAELERMRAGA